MGGRKVIRHTSPTQTISSEEGPAPPPTVIEEVITETAVEAPLPVVVEPTAPEPIVEVTKVEEVPKVVEPPAPVVELPVPTVVELTPPPPQEPILPAGLGPVTVIDPFKPESPVETKIESLPEPQLEPLEVPTISETELKEYIEGKGVKQNYPPIPLKFWERS